VNWDKFKYVVYDVPHYDGTYAERYSFMGTCNVFLFLIFFFLTSSSSLEKRLQPNPHIMIAGKEVCQGSEHLDKYFQEIIIQGGEGIILRDPKALYKPGRSLGYLKHKVRNSQI